MEIQIYKVGWLLVTFDLPVGTPAQRKIATNFREFLKDDGFLMLQWSVYARPCVSFARQETHLARVVTKVPEEGNVRCIFITQAQWERSYILSGQPCSRQPAEGLPEQLQLW
ncbi:MAG: CRISPR-associated endonuclease Cas2 [Verrucomicrobia bacterium]|nr:CRISPR-associated endonuclease Cas2 [Verrucomicrobiota bacterium]